MCVCALLRALCSVAAPVSLSFSLSARPAPKLRIFSIQTPPPHPRLFYSLTPSPPKSSEWPPSSSTGGTIDSSPVSLSSTSLPTVEDTPVLKVCHNNGPEEELFRAQPLLTQPPHTDPRQTYIVMVTIHNVCQLCSFVTCA